MFPIRQHLLTLTCLKSTAKSVLIEVCGLAENGGKGACFASNASLAHALGISLATVVRTVASLENGGLLVGCVVKAEGNRRYLRPTPRLRACYSGGSEADQLLAAANLTIVKTGKKPELTIVKSEGDYSQNSEVTIVKSEGDYSQNASRVIGDQHYQQYYQQHPLSAGERWELQKKIGDLQAEVEHLKAQLARVQAPPVAGAPPVGYRDFEAAWPAQLVPPFEPPAFRAAWAKYAGAMAELGKPFRGNIGEQEALSTLGRFADADMQRALRILSHNITQRYRTLTNDDGTPTPKPGAGSSDGTRSSAAQQRRDVAPQGSPRSAA